MKKQMAIIAGLVLVVVVAVMVLVRDANRVGAQNRETVVSTEAQAEVGKGENAEKHPVGKTVVVTGSVVGGFSK
ncbi:MAG: hypothetical protein WCG02_02920 [Candidatus Taylorbacteria bacterium]